MTNKVAMCLCVVYIKILMLYEHFEPKLMKIGRIELQLFKFSKWTHKRIIRRITRELNMNLSDVPNLQSGYCRQGIAYRGPKIRIYIRSEFARVTGFR